MTEYISPNDLVEHAPDVRERGQDGSTGLGIRLGGTLYTRIETFVRSLARTEEERHGLSNRTLPNGKRVSTN